MRPFSEFIRILVHSFWNFSEKSQSLSGIFLNFEIWNFQEFCKTLFEFSAEKVANPRVGLRWKFPGEGLYRFIKGFKKKYLHLT